MTRDDTLRVHLGLYLLPLRHPTTVARQLSTLWEYAGSRLVFVVGVGGDDRREIELCGIDSRTRGRRMDDCLTILRGLLGGRAPCRRSGTASPCNRVYACGVRDSRRRPSGSSREKRIAVPAGRTGSALRSVRQFERSPLEVHHGRCQARF
ncbi:MAG: LLM class flavin-dependent oxidoreductase [Candidatus Binatia bacterium]